MQAMRGTSLKSCSTLLHLAGGGGDDSLQAAVEGAALGGYAFSHYKTKNDDNGGIQEVRVRNPVYTGHPIRFQLDTESGINWTGNPVLTGQQIRF